MSSSGVVVVDAARMVMVLLAVAWKDIVVGEGSTLAGAADARPVDHTCFCHAGRVLMETLPRPGNSIEAFDILMDTQAATFVQQPLSRVFLELCLWLASCFTPFKARLFSPADELYVPVALGVLYGDGCP